MADSATASIGTQGDGVTGTPDPHARLPVDDAARPSPVVMVIEDEPNIAEAIRFILQRAGWTVAIHDQGDDALTRIEALAPRLIILDVMLPGRSGFDILEALRSHDSLAGIPVIMLTAKGHATDRQRAERLGASLFMTKPFSNTELLTAVRRLLLP
ncbi:MAG: response regulator transcription factor [Pararhodobacter sp.]